MVKPLWLVKHGPVLVPLPRKNGARRSSGFTMLWRLCRRRHSSWTSRSSFFLSSGGKDTSRAARAPPLRDAYCTLDKAIYRSWVLLAQVCLCSRACCIAPMQRCTPRFPWNATILPILDRLLCYGFSKPLGMVLVCLLDQGWNGSWSLNFRASSSLLSFFFGWFDWRLLEEGGLDWSNFGFRYCIILLNFDVPMDIGSGEFAFCCGSEILL